MIAENRPPTCYDDRAMASGPVEGDVLKGRIRLETRLGTGGFSSVWRGTDLPTNRTVAVKILHPEQAAISGCVERFEQEAELLSRLAHTSIARAYDDDTRSAPRFFTLEYVPGETLQARLRRCSERSRPIPLAGVAWILNQIAGALAYAHRQNIVHRDLKPANVMVNAPHAPPFLKVLDFGAAKELEGSRFDPTTVGRVIGSIAYMAPEQLRSLDVDGRTDQFALAVMMFEILTLRRAWAFDADGAPLPVHESIGTHNSQLDIMKRIVRGERPRVGELRPNVPEGVDAALIRAMSPQPNLRFTTIDEFREAFYIALLDAPEMAPAWGVEDVADTRPIDDPKGIDDGPTKTGPVERSIETLVGGVDAPEPEMPSTAELPQLVWEAPLPTTRARRRGVKAAETEVRDLEATEDDLSDAAEDMMIETIPSTSDVDRGS